MNTPRVNKTPKGVSKVSTVVHCGQSSGSRLKTSMANSYDWLSILSKDNNGTDAVSVSSFKFAPLSDVWDDLVTCGLKVEVRNTDTDLVPNDGHSEGYWIASVVKFAGYYVLLRYEGFGNDSSKDFWVNIFTNAIHPVGWCASQGKVLIPPKTVESKFADWREFLVKRLTGSRTLPENFNEQLRDSLKSRFSVGMRLEVVDKKRISAVRVAFVDQIIGGRLHIMYEGEEDTDTGFWCHQFSPLIHPVGWAQLVGHELRATKEYAEESLRKAMTRSFDDKDAEWTLFPPIKTTLGPTTGSSGQIMHASHPTSSGQNSVGSGHNSVGSGQNSKNVPKFEEGMKLEAIDPLNLSTICVATVTKVLRSNYLMIGIDGMMAADGSDWFCYHATSPCIFPVGFCHFNSIELTPPRNYVGEFEWMKYLKETGSRAAPVSLFKKEIPSHGFKEGYYLEAVDLMEPRLICVATVTKVVGRLLRVHFNGWDDSYDQWCDCESPELFPSGWCQLVGYPLEPPKGQGDSFTLHSHDSKRKKGTYKGKRGRRKCFKNGSQRSSSLGDGVLSDSFGDGVLSDSLGDGILSESHRDGMLSESINDGSIEEEEEEMEEDEENFEHNHDNKSLKAAGDSLISTHNSTSGRQSINQRLGQSDISSLNSTSGRQSINQRLGQSDLVSNTPPTIRPVGRMSKSSGSSNHHSSGLPNSSVIVKPSPPEPVMQLDGKNPIKWSVREVSYFLKTNNAAGYIHSFAEQGIDGTKLLQLTEEAVMKLTDNKVGPALKIKALIETLKKGKR